jgi:hypothetical protein
MPEKYKIFGLFLKPNFSLLNMCFSH